MSKYQELKDVALAAASKYRETGSLEDRDALDKAEEKLHAYERWAAELIERAQKKLRNLQPACIDHHGINTCIRCSLVVSCDIPKILTDIDALMKGGAK